MSVNDLSRESEVDIEDEREWDDEQECADCGEPLYDCACEER